MQRGRRGLQWLRSGLGRRRVERVSEGRFGAELLCNAYVCMIGRWPAARVQDEKETQAARSNAITFSQSPPSPGQPHGKPARPSFPSLRSMARESYRINWFNFPGHLLRRPPHQHLLVLLHGITFLILHLGCERARIVVDAVGSGVGQDTGRRDSVSFVCELDGNFDHRGRSRRLRWPLGRTVIVVAPSRLGRCCFVGLIEVVCSVLAPD